MQTKERKMNMEKKYILTDESIEFFGHKLYRIEALRSFGDVKAGDKGGFIECEDNLSHGGNAWVYGNAKVCQRAAVNDNASVKHSAVVMDRAVISGDAEVLGSSEISGNAWVSQQASVIDASVFDYARAGGFARIMNAKIAGRARVLGVAEVLHPNQVICFENILGDVLTFWRGRHGTIQVHSLKHNLVWELSVFKWKVKQDFKGYDRRLMLQACRLAKTQIVRCVK